MQRIAAAGTTHRLLTAATFAVSVGVLQCPVAARTVDLDRPQHGQFVQDLARMIDDDHAGEIERLCEQLFAHRDASVYVVTVSSMAEYSLVSPDTISIETFAQNLFRDWGIGYLRVQGKSWNTGILLVVSRGDQKARIELGAGWERTRDDLCQQILDDQIVTRFKDGDFSLGILAGVRALDDMVRGRPLPARPWTRSMKQTAAFGAGLLLFTVVSMFRRGRDGWGWALWTTVFGALGWLLFLLCGRRRGHDGLDRFPVGGGATGRW